IKYFMVMKMFNKKLHELLQEEFGKRGIEQIEIPFYVKENLSKVAKIEQGDDRARLAFDMFCYRLLKYIGAYFTVLPRTDAIIFTG
ncbi:hypothetical protein VWN94_10130, partial [Campylobacter coli]|nr:hypothetical protein [Campylobacter coli]